MKLEKLHIKNFKSLVDVEIDQPNPFTVFVGPNGSGKSNIFEALEFLNYCYKLNPSEAKKLFGRVDILNISYSEQELPKKVGNPLKPFKFENPETYDVGISLRIGIERFSISVNFAWADMHEMPLEMSYDNKKTAESDFFSERFSRIFIRNHELRKQNIFTDHFLNIDASNLENVLGRILKNESTREAIFEHLRVLVPEFEEVEVIQSSLSKNNELAVYEKSFKQPLTKNLISDGTYNILSLLTALYQSDGPQFLCIEEPENGLHPFAIKQLVQLFRQQCEEKGHYIWLNTHSQTLVSELRPEEIITVNKENGATKIKQHKGQSLYSLTMDEAWLSNALGGGMPW